MTKLKNHLIIIFAGFFIFGFFLLGIFLPDSEVSISERRKLATLPKADTSSILSGSFMSEFDNYCADQFPMRDGFRSLKAYTTYYAFLQKDNNGIYNSSGNIVKMEYPMNTESINHATSRFKFIYDNYLAKTDAKIYLSIVPDKNAFASKESGHLSMDYKLFADTVTQQMPYAEYIDIFPLLELSDYYATDTHWRQEKITDVATHLGNSMGIKLTESYSQITVSEPFYGVYHGQYALPLAPDTLTYLESDTLKNCIVRDLESNTEIPMYDTEKLTSSDPMKIADPYEMFLSGPNRSVVEIENPLANTERELVIIRDSYANALAPLLTSGYKKITLVDIRLLSPSYLGNILSFDSQDVLFLQSTLVLNDSKEIK